MRPVPPMTEMVGNSLLGRLGGLGAHGPSSDEDADGVEVAEVAMML